MNTTSCLLRAGYPFAMITALAALSGCVSPRLNQTADTYDATTSSFAAAGDVRPEPLHTVAPQYPFQLKRDGIPGTVNMSCIVDENGRVRDARVEQSTHIEFNRPALEALERWTFTPARRNGVPYAVRVAIPMSFTLRDD